MNAVRHILHSMIIEARLLQQSGCTKACIYFPSPLQNLFLAGTSTCPLTWRLPSSAGAGGGDGLLLSSNSEAKEPLMQPPQPPDLPVARKGITLRGLRELQRRIQGLCEEGWFDRDFESLPAFHGKGTRDYSQLTTSQVLYG